MAGSVNADCHVTSWEEHDIFIFTKEHMSHQKTWNHEFKMGSLIVANLFSNQSCRTRRWWWCNGQLAICMDKTLHWEDKSPSGSSWIPLKMWLASFFCVASNWWCSGRPLCLPLLRGQWPVRASKCFTSRVIQPFNPGHAIPMCWWKYLLLAPGECGMDAE